MLLNGKLITDITEADLVNMVGVISESQTLDFKEHAYPTYPDPDNNGKSTWDRLEFFADLTSFANAFGGWIICGMKEEGGIATELCGLGSSLNIEREIQRLEQAANSGGIEPRLPTLKFRPIDIVDPQKSKALLIYVGRSFMGPHRVKETSRFHARRSNGKDEMNVDELRIAFNLAESLTDRVKNFRKDRVDILSSPHIHEDIPVVLEQGPCLILHSIPLTTLSVGTGIELTSFKFVNNAFPHVNVQNSFMGSGAFFNYFGVVFSREYKPGEVREYFQVFRSGVIEYVQVIGNTNPNGEKVISPAYIENQVRFNLPIALNMQRNLGIETPLIVMLSLSRIKDYRYTVENEFYYNFNLKSFNRDQVQIPDLILNSYDQDVRVFMRHSFNILWNAGGLNGSHSYDDKGDWIRGN